MSNKIKTPQEIILEINTALESIAQGEDYKKVLGELGMETEETFYTSAIENVDQAKVALLERKCFEQKILIEA